MSETLAVQSNMFGILDQNINRVFKTEEVKNKAGEVIGARMSLKPKRDIAEAYGLTKRTDKDALEALCLKDRDSAFTKMKQHLAGMNGDNTAAVFDVRTLKSGIVKTTMVTHTISRSQRLSDEKLALGMFPVELYPAMTLEDKLAGIVAMRASQEAHLAKNLIEAGEAK